MAPSAPGPLDASEVPLEESQRVLRDGDLVGRHERVGEPLARVELTLQLDGAGGVYLARHDPRRWIQDQIRDTGWVGGSGGGKRSPQFGLEVFTVFLLEFY